MRLYISEEKSPKLTMVNKRMRLLNEDESKLQLGDGDRGHHIYKEIWMLLINEILSCSQEHGNSEDYFAVSVIKDGDIVGHVPHEISHVVWYFIEHDGIVDCQVTGSREKGWKFLALKGQYPCYNYKTYALNKRVSMTSTAYALNRQYALNKHVRLITGLYGMPIYIVFYHRWQK